MVPDAKERVLCQCEWWILVFHTFCFCGSQKRNSIILCRWLWKGILVFLLNRYKIQSDCNTPDFTSSFIVCFTRILSCFLLARILRVR